MLHSLHIDAYALISHLDLTLGEGFSVITGETGAGKSILLGAIGLLQGKRADAQVIKGDTRKCVVEATFSTADKEILQLLEDENIDIDDAQPSEIILRREVTASGKSRAFINDTPVLLNTLRAVSDKLIDIHSQHQNLLLSRADFLRETLDSIDIEGKDTMLLTRYSEAYNAFHKAEKELQSHLVEIEKAKGQQEFLEFQLQQLTEAHIEAGEECMLEQEQQAMSHAEEIKTALYSAIGAIDPASVPGYGMQNEGQSLSQALRTAEHAINGIADYLAEAQVISNRIQSLRIETDDILGELCTHADNIEFDPQRLSFIEERLDTIYTLLKRHAVQDTIELVKKKDDLQQQLNDITFGDETTQSLQKARDKSEKEMLELGKALTAQRQKAAQVVTTQLIETLKGLGMPNVRIEFSINPRTTPDIFGLDDIQLLFSANTSSKLRNVADVASGGEIARVMLAIKALTARHSQLPTIVFDEIDTGVSGTMAAQMGNVMKEMSSTCQVICITHLPQIAALGKQHYLVAKHEDAETTETSVTQLNESARIHTIADMLSGSEVTETAIDNAKTLLGL